jgi:hypothetical protein
MRMSLMTDNMQIQMDMLKVGPTTFMGVHHPTSTELRMSKEVVTLGWDTQPMASRPT